MSITRGTLSRRTYLRAVGAAGTVGLTGLAGCAGTDSEGERDTANDERFEIAHEWTDEEAQALEALVDGFEAEYGEVEIALDRVSEPSADTAHSEIRDRVIDGDPPGTFQSRPGEGLRPYLDEGAIAPINDVWNTDMREGYLDGPMEAAAPDGDAVCVPIAVNRLNNLFYNVEIVEDADVDLDGVGTPEGFVDALESLYGDGVVGMAHGPETPWSTLQLWETVFVGQHGTSAFDGLVSGDAAEYEQEVHSAFEMVERYAEYGPEDADATGDNEAADRLVSGDAATLHQGDWVARRYDEEFEYGTDWDVVPFPGTEGIYTMVMSAFVLPSGSQSPETAREFLAHCGTADAQQLITSHTGSIPPRTDVPDDEFGPFLRDQMTAFTHADFLTTTITHGSAVDPRVVGELEAVVAEFDENLDPETATDGVVAALE